MSSTIGGIVRTSSGRAALRAAQGQGPCFLRHLSCSALCGSVLTPSVAETDLSSKSLSEMKNNWN
eukprot:5443828-Prymnesium_polylepis.1